MYNWGSVFGCSPFTFAGQSVWIVLLLYIRRRQIMTFNAMTERYEEITVCGKPALFTSIRIQKEKSYEYLWLLQNFYCKTEH